MTATISALCAGALAAAQPASDATASPGATYQPNDYCLGQCGDILPPGANGSATLTEILLHQTLGAKPRHSDDQLGRYAKLADGYPTLTTGTINEFFLDASFGVADNQVERRYTPRDDVVIVRDKTTGAPHIYGDTRSGTTFGAGYAAAEDRLWVMDLLRRVGRGQLSSYAGGAPANRALEQGFFVTAPYTEQELQDQVDRAAARGGERGQLALADAKSYLDGVNEYISDARRGRYFPGEYVLTGHIDPVLNIGQIEPFKLTDLVVLAAVVGAQFGAGGGGEVQAAIAKLAFQERYGAEAGERAWQAFRAANDPEHVLTVHDGSFPYGKTPADPQGRAMPDPGSVEQQQAVFDAQGGAARAGGDDGVLPAGLLSESGGMSNALVVSGAHTESSHPIAVFGPQTGYFAPQLLLLQELQGPGISARGASFAGLSFYVLLGRGQDYSWSATSAGQDVIDTYAVELCEPGGGAPTKQSNHYLWRGACRPMQVIERENSWKPTLADPTPAGSYTLKAFRTGYGPVTHRATVDGTPVAYTTLRSSWLREIDSVIGFQMFNDPAEMGSVAAFQHSASQINYTFNWFYVNSSDTGYYNSGANPVRASDVDPSMPIVSDPAYEWRGWDPSDNTADYTPFQAHPHSENQAYYVNWNNGQAADYSSGGYDKSAVHRVDLLDRRVKALIADGGKVTRGSLTKAMAEAGLTDLRAERLLPKLFRVIGDADIDDPILADAVADLKAWHAAGALRAESSPGSKRYAHAEAIRVLDAWWP
ncbi:MAG: penicillin acylase family protein, partial [Micromonosporaceae bacterium]